MCSETGIRSAAAADHSGSYHASRNDEPSGGAVQTIAPRNPASRLRSSSATARAVSLVARRASPSRRTGSTAHSPASQSL